MNKHYRQGDVLLVERTRRKPTGPDVAREGDRIVLAHGEVTGHAHAVCSLLAKVFEEAGTRYLLPGDDTPLTHEEHSSIGLKKSKMYEVVRQVEYTPTALRNVAD